MRLFGRCTVLLTVLLLLFCFRTIRADRSELPPITVDYHLAAPAEPRYSFGKGGSVASAVNQAFAHLDLDRQEATWSRLVREALNMNTGLVANPDAADLHGPAANRVSPGTVLTMPAVSVVQDGDKGVSHVLLRLNPELRNNGRAMIRAIKATITANADLIRNADPDELYDGRFNVIQAGDVLILPPEVMPEEIPLPETRIADEPLVEPTRPVEPEPPAVIVAAEPPEPEPLTPAEPEPPTVITQAETTAPEPAAPAPVVESPEPVVIAASRTVEPDPWFPEPKEPLVVAEAETPEHEPWFTEPREPVVTARAETVEPEPWFPEPKQPVAVAEAATPEPVSEEQPPLFEAPEAPPAVAAVEAAPEERPAEPAAEMAAALTEPAGEAVIDPTATVAGLVEKPASEPFPAMTELEFNGPIGLTAGETKDRFIPEDKPWTASATHLLYAYLLTGLSLLGGLVIFITRWLERDRHFREQLNLLLAPVVFLLTLGRVRRRTVIDATVKDTDPAAVPQQDSKQEHHGSA